MAWKGYVEFDGNELVNVARTEAYLRHKPWFKATFGNDVLVHMLGDKPYRSALQDDAPWTDPDVRDSYLFYGAYPLDITGIENSTRTADIVESIGDGAVPGSVRHASKQIVFSLALMAENDAGAEYGMRWLNRVLAGAVCGPNDTTLGANLCFLSAEPQMEIYEIPWGSIMSAAEGGWASTTGIVADGGDAFGSGADDPDILGDPFLTGGDARTRTPLLSRSRSLFEVKTIGGVLPTECLIPYKRRFARVTVTSPPTVTRKMHNLSAGGEVWTVQFTATAGTPFQYGPELDVIEGFLDPMVPVPWAGGVEPPGAAIDLDGFMLSDELDCAKVTPTPLFDPLTPALVFPPDAPSIPLGNFTPPVNWRRRQITIPKQYVPAWGEVVPVVNIHARDDELRNLRIRFYADPYDVGDIADDPCSFCGDFVVSYIPQGMSLTLDGVSEVVTATGAGGIVRRAESLVFSSQGTPFSWPQLTCGFGYIATFDLPAQAAPPVIDLSLVERII